MPTDCAAAHIWTTQEVMRALSERYGVTEKTGVSYLLGISSRSGWRYARGELSMPPDIAEKAAAMLDISPAWLVLCLATEKCQDDKLTRRMRDILLAAAHSAPRVFPVFLLLAVQGRAYLAG